MQTFLPYSSFERCAKVLDYRRLGKQRIEAHQILSINYGLTPNSKWRNHVCVRMWRGYDRALLEYAYQIVFEWRNRGFVDNMLERFNSDFMALNSAPIVRPPWLGEKQLHTSHRAALLHKQFEFYSQVKPRWKEEPQLDYWWPVPRYT